MNDNPKNNILLSENMTKKLAILEYFDAYFDASKYSGIVSLLEFRKNLRNTDITTHKSAISYQKILRKYVKAKLDIEFLKKCKSADVYPKFVRWKHVKNKKVN